MCLPGLHITLGIFQRLFTLLEDECHKLDLGLASLTTPESSDRHAYSDYSTIVKRERDLLDEKVCLEGQLKWLQQTITLLSLTSSNPSTDPQITIVATIMNQKRERLNDIVRGHTHTHTLLLHINVDQGP